MDEGARAYSFEGNHTLAIFKESEKYNFVKRALQDIIDEVKDTPSIEVDGTVYKIEYFLGGDWKFLALATGKLHNTCVLMQVNALLSTFYCKSHHISIVLEKLSC